MRSLLLALAVLAVSSTGCEGVPLFGGCDSAPGEDYDHSAVKLTATNVTAQGVTACQRAGSPFSDGYTLLVQAHEGIFRVSAAARANAGDYPPLLVDANVADDGSQSAYSTDGGVVVEYVPSATPADDTPVSSVTVDVLTLPGVFATFAVTLDVRFTDGREMKDEFSALSGNPAACAD